MPLQIEIDLCFFLDDCMNVMLKNIADWHIEMCLRFGHMILNVSSWLYVAQSLDSAICFPFPAYVHVRIHV